MASAKTLLARELRGIRSERGSTAAAATHSGFSADWASAVASLRELGASLASDARVLHFIVAADGEEVSVKVADRTARGYRYLRLSRRAPVQQAARRDEIWLYEFGQDDMRFTQPLVATQEFVRRIAGALA